MFVLRTGLQGNGKTLNTIKEVDKKAAKENRIVYYHNLTGLKPDHPVLEATWEQFDNPHEWFKLPNNAMIVIDEAQHFFRVRPQGSRVPEYASALETMRKQGHELHCITQNPTLIDSHFRKLCNSHIHYVRGHQGKVIKRWKFERVITDVEKKNDFSEGESTRVLLDEKYFDCYESVAEETGHHFKFKPPRALIVLAVCLVVIAALSYRFYTHRIAPSQAPAVASVVGGEQQGFSGSVVSTAVESMTPEQYVDARVPRVPDMPSSAPIYDQVTQPVAYPKTFCVSSRDEGLLERAGSKMTMGYFGGRLYGCRCNTQQGTRVDISFDACIAHVEHGAFDPAKPDRQQALYQAGDATIGKQAGGGVGLVEGRDGTTRTPAARLTVIEDTSRTARTLL